MCRNPCGAPVLGAARPTHAPCIRVAHPGESVDEVVEERHRRLAGIRINPAYQGPCVQIDQADARVGFGPIFVVHCPAAHGLPQLTCQPCLAQVGVLDPFDPFEQLAAVDRDQMDAFVRIPLFMEWCEDLIEHVVGAMVAKRSRAIEVDQHRHAAGCMALPNAIRRGRGAVGS